MEKHASKPVSVIRFVLAFLVVKLVAGAVLALYVFATDKELSISSTAITIAAVGLAMLWYAKSVKRPMSSSEIVKFSAGNVLADIALSLAWVTATMWLLDLPVSWEGVGATLGGSPDRQTAQLVWAAALAIGSVQVFLLSAFFAWLISRNLPQFQLPGETSE